MGKINKSTLQYREGHLPEHLGEILQNADETDLRILVTLQMLADKESGTAPLGGLSELLGCSEAEINASLKFWRGAGILGTAKTKRAAVTEDASCAKEEAQKAPERVTAHKGGVLEQSGALPQYSSSELADMIERRQVSVAFIDEAQRVMGKVFRTYDTSVLVGIVDRLGFEEAAVLAILAYLVKKGKKTLRYAEQLAIAFYDEGITDTEAVLARIHRMEQSGEAIGKIRVLYGAANREMTSTEKRLFTAWCEKLAYDIEVIRMAYDITVDSIQKPVPKYTNSILEAWYAEGLRTAEEVRRYLEAEKEKKSEKTAAGTAKSYEVEDFFEAALKRSYEEML